MTRDCFRCVECGSIDPSTYTDRIICCETPVAESESVQQRITWHVWRAWTCCK